MLSALKCVLVCFAVAFLILSGNAHAQGPDCPDPLPAPTTDKNVLILLYCNTDGPNWIIPWQIGQSLGNDLQASNADWRGVETDTSGKVVKIELRSNGLSGEVLSDLHNLTNLEVLEISNSNEYLETSDRQLTGSIPTELGSLTNLRKLNLRGNRLSGEIPSELGNLINLSALDLDGNMLSGRIPSELGNLPSLQSIFLSNNKLSGGIPVSLLENSPTLSQLYLHDNMLSGKIPDLSKVRYFGELYLHNNELSGKIPDWIENLPSLNKLALYNNKLTGGIPDMRISANLLELYLDNNKLSGEIPDSLLSLTKLSHLYLSENQLSGTIPTWLSTMGSLQELLLRNNKLSGSIPTELEDLTELFYLYLSGNQLSGTIPSELGSLSKLDGLGLSRNKLDGEIPPELGNLTNLIYLYLGHNMLDGEIPPELGNLTRPEQLDLSDNMLSGEIPTELANLTLLTHLYLDNNMLSGEIPSGFARLTYLEEVYLNNNMLTGSFPPDPVPPSNARLGDAPSIKELAYWGNGGLTWDFHYFNDIVGPKVDRAVLRALHDNNNGENWINRNNWLTDDMDMWNGVTVNSDGRISHLNLANNNLTGKITNALEALDDLETLNLARNRRLTGTLPLRLMNLSVLRTLDIRCTGIRTPTNAQFRQWLNGITFRQTCPQPPPPPPPPPPQPPEQVTGVMVVEGVKELSVSWDEVSRADGYKVQWKSGSERFDPSRQHIITNGGTTSYIISELVAEQEYKVRVIATKSGARDGMPSLEVTGTPGAPPPPPPQPPEQVAGVMVAEGVEELSVSWVEVSGADGYKVQWKSGSERFDPSRQHIITNGGTTSYIISELVAEQEYKVRVIATKSGARDGMPSLEVTGTPGTPPPSRSSGGGGCAIAPDESKGNMSRSVLLNLLLTVSVPLLGVSRKRR